MMVEADLEGLDSLQGNAPKCINTETNQCWLNLASPVSGDEATCKQDVIDKD